MTELEGLIRYWEGQLKSNRHLLDIGTINFFEMTIKNLKRLRDIDEFNE